MYVFDIIVVGMRYHGSCPEEVLTFDSFKLVPEPSNLYDSNAIKVMGLRGDDEVFLGYVSRSSQENVPELKTEGCIFALHSKKRDSLESVLLRLFFGISLS